MSAKSSDAAFFREVSCGGRSLLVKQLYIGDVGCVVWDAALVLCRFLENWRYFPAGFWAGKTVLELGSGTGIVGLAAGSLGASVELTDLPEFVELMKSNVELNKSSISGSVSARSLVWGQDVSDFHSPSVILMSDVVYYKEVLNDLVETLEKLSCEGTQIVMSYEERTTGDKPEIEKAFFELMGKNFSQAVVPFSKQDPEMRSQDIHIVIFRKLCHPCFLSAHACIRALSRALDTPSPIS